MKRKLIKRNKSFLTKIFQTGWPIGMYMHDNWSKQTVEEGRYYKAVKLHAYTKRGRIDGTYLAWLGRDPTPKNWQK